MLNELGKATVKEWKEGKIGPSQVRPNDWDSLLQHELSLEGKTVARYSAPSSHGPQIATVRPGLNVPHKPGLPTVLPAGLRTGSCRLGTQ